MKYKWKTRPYRHQVDAVKKLLANGYGGALLCEPRTGKTKVMVDYASILHQANKVSRVLVVCPMSVMGVWVNEIYQHCPEKVDIVVWDREGRKKRELPKPTPGVLSFVIVNYDAFSTPGRRLPSGGRSRKTGRVAIRNAVRRWRPHLVLLDECLVVDTPISTPHGPRLIQDLQVGDEVWAYNHEQNQLVIDKVRATFSRKTELPIGYVNDVGMTPNHPVWTEEYGYVLAGLLEGGETGWWLDEEEMRVVRKNLRSPTRPESILQSQLFRQVADAAARDQGKYERKSLRQLCSSGDAISKDKETDSRSNLSGESSKISSFKSESFSRFQSKESSSTDQQDQRLASTYRGQRSKSNDGRDALGRGLRWLGDKLLRDDGRRGITPRLRDRRLRSRLRNSHRSRWLQSPYCQAKENGSTQGEKIESSRLDSISIYQRRGSKTPVYNIETDQGNYFAHGLLVHNSHRIKSPSAKKSTMLHTLGRDVPYRVIATGTAVTKRQRVFDVYSQWKFLNPERFADVPTFAEFRDRYGVWVARDGYLLWIRNQNTQELRRRVHADAYAVRRDECFDLPSRREQIVPIELQESRNVYREMAEEMIAQLKRGELVEASLRIVQTLRLSQITGGHVKTTEGNVRRVGREKLRVLEELLADLFEADEKVVVGARFRAEIASVLRLCRQLNVPAHVIAGGVSREARDNHIRLFRDRGGPRCLVMQPQAGSLGIDLSAASTFVWYSLTSSWVDFAQAEDRIALSRRSCTYMYLLAQGTVDEVMYDGLRLDHDVAKAVAERPEDLLRI